MSHIHEKIDFTVTAYIVFGEKVLLRMHEKYHVWIGIGGHVELHEDPNQALLREIKEECGVPVEFIRDTTHRMINGKARKDLVPPDRMDIHYTDSVHQHMNMVYFVKALTDEINPNEDEANTEFKWCSREDLDEMEVDEQVKELCIEALLKFKK